MRRIYKLTVTDSIYCNGGGCIPRGASVEAISNDCGAFDYENAKDAFERKYGLRPDTMDIQLRCRCEEQK